MPHGVKQQGHMRDDLVCVNQQMLLFNIVCCMIPIRQYVFFTMYSKIVQRGKEHVLLFNIVCCMIPIRQYVFFTMYSQIVYRGKQHALLHYIV